MSGHAASARIRTNKGIAVLPLHQEGAAWRITGPVRYVKHFWLRLTYRFSGGAMGQAVAASLAERAKAVTGGAANALSLIHI